MRQLAILLLALAVSPFPLAHAESAPSEARFLSKTRRLTLDGKRSGEGYFHPDGHLLCFQSEREPGNPFYQIYLLDLLSGETARLSPGVGKTTCSSFSQAPVAFFSPRLISIQKRSRSKRRN